MIQKLTPLIFLPLFFAVQVCEAQNYFGSWTLDWSKVLDNEKHKGTIVSDSLKTINGNSEKNPVWVLSSDSLKVFQGGSLISAAEIRWTRNDRFEITDDQKKKKLIHYIDEIGEEKIKMHTGYSDSEIYLRKL